MCGYARSCVLGQTASFILNRTIAYNAQGDYFPLWGTCQGFQLLCVLLGGEDVLQHNAFDSEDLSLALNLTDTAPSSQLFGTMPADVLTILTQQAVTENLHHDGVAPDAFQVSRVPLTQPPIVPPIACSRTHTCHSSSEMMVCA